MEGDIINYQRPQLCRESVILNNLLSGSVHHDDSIRRSDTSLKNNSQRNQIIGI